jgi:hypothetical protein
MKRKLTIAGIFLTLGVAMGIAILLSNQKDRTTGTDPGNSVSFTPDGKLVPPQNEQAKMTIVAEMPKGTTTPATNSNPAASALK